MSVQALKIYYEIMSFDDAFPKYSSATIEEKEKSYQKIKGIFKNLIKDSDSASAKIQFDDTRRKILCGYRDSKEIKAAFPDIKKFIKSSPLIKSSEPNIVDSCCRLSPEYEQEMAEKSKLIKKQKEEEFKKLVEEMEFFYKKASFPPCTPIKLEKDLTSKELVTQLLKQADGFGIGDTHNEVSSIFFIISHMGDFKKLGVSTFFWEGYPEHLEKQVEKYFNPKNPVDKFPKKLAECLTKKGNFLIKNILYDSEISDTCKDNAKSSFFEFFKTLKTNGIKLKTLEIREFCEERPKNFDDSELDVEDAITTDRMKPMNYLAQKFILTFKKEHPGEKYIYWDGFNHNRTYGTRVIAPGIPELTGDPWILLSDVKDKTQIINTSTKDGKKVLVEKFKGYCPTGKMLEPNALLLLNPEYNLQP